MAESAGNHEHEADSDPPSDQVADPARGTSSIPRDENPPMHLPADRVGRKVLGAGRMPRMRTMVESALAVGRFAARVKALGLAAYRKSSRQVSLPGGVASGRGVETE